MVPMAVTEEPETLELMAVMAPTGTMLCLWEALLMMALMALMALMPSQYYLV